MRKKKYPTIKLQPKKVSGRSNNTDSKAISKISSKNQDGLKANRFFFQEKS